MEPIEITDERGLTRCVIDQARGASIVRWETSAGMPIVSRNVAGEDERAKPGCFIMSPWTNRVARARMSFRGREYALDKRVAADGTAMHGDVRSHPWTIVDRSPVSARLTFESRSIAGGANFPWAFGAEVRYELVRSVLRIDLTLRNRADEPMPLRHGAAPVLSAHADERIGASTEGDVPVPREVRVTRDAARWASSAGRADAEVRVAGVLARVGDR
jgi:aldose 1-epimerase